jgi:cation diffusion facilitator CzcD-associated flavoprotein CzcO
MPAIPHVAILGAGPVGLDAALACADAGWPFTVYEASGAVAAHLRAWGHVRLFTPWELNSSHRMRTHLKDVGRSVPDDDVCPTGAELVSHLLQPVAELPALAGKIRHHTRVAAIARTGLLKHEQIGTTARAAAPFTLLLDTPDGEDTAQATLVLDCTGTYSHPNTLGDGGIPAPGERALDHRITRTLPDADHPARWKGTVLLVGAGKSAQTAARDLATLPDTRIEWAVRGTEPDWGAIPDDTLPGRQELVDSSQALAEGAHQRVAVHTGAHVQSLHSDGDRIHVRLATTTGPREVTCDHVVSLTGYTGDPTLYRQLQVHECYATGAPMNLSAALLAASGASADCLAQPTPGIDRLRTPEPDFFILGAKSYGRLNSFLLRTGYQQVDEVISG